MLLDSSIMLHTFEDLNELIVMEDGMASIEVDEKSANTATTSDDNDIAGMQFKLPITIK